MGYESRLNKPGTTEQHCDTAGDRSDKGGSSLNYRQSCNSNTSFTDFGTPDLMFSGGREFSSSEKEVRNREFIEFSSCQGNQQNGDKPQKPSKDSEHFAQIICTTG